MRLEIVAMLATFCHLEATEEHSETWPHYVDCSNHLVCLSMIVDIYLWLHRKGHLEERNKRLTERKETMYVNTVQQLYNTVCCKVCEELVPLSFQIFHASNSGFYSM